jgi:hypothetical protein
MAQAVKLIRITHSRRIRVLWVRCDCSETFKHSTNRPQVACFRCGRTVHVKALLEETCAEAEQESELASAPGVAPGGVAVPLSLERPGGGDATEEGTDGGHAARAAAQAEGDSLMQAAASLARLGPLAGSVEAVFERTRNQRRARVRDHARARTARRRAR